ncbi:hypothetical protein VB780_13515 [Leptolyngbya sp. CCNP1308]|uniref:hypothetical protein n=1 Tax=Leptolyngbya sp. CCNP1308 TaxID=3110255 RepID=UPI002B1F1B5B|nr:hypothetical protein [Leptolyngbya sp. CCNP1308]MEA5449597.1 hypothetical protein [Leptolyngbya sp. CCNP1308]
MGNPTVQSSFSPLDSTLLTQDNHQSDDPVGGMPLSFNHRVILTALSIITPLLVLTNCLDKIQGTFVAEPIRPALALAQPAHSGLDYLGIHAKLLWAYAPPGGMAQPVHCISVAAP